MSMGARIVPQHRGTTPAEVGARARRGRRGRGASGCWGWACGRSGPGPGVAAAVAAVAAALLAAPAVAPAATSCSFNEGQLDVELAGANDRAYLTRAPGGEIVVAGDAGEVLCSGGTPHASTTNAIVVFNRPGATDASVWIDGVSRFAPAWARLARTSEPERSRSS